ncbi:MAG: hypothetical protein WAN65_17820 [Candidatus Sulfotelmatobacter sp.]
MPTDARDAPDIRIPRWMRLAMPDDVAQIAALRRSIAEFIMRERYSALAMWLRWYAFRFFGETIGRWYCA